MESSALVRRYLQEKARLDASKVLERDRPATFLRDQRTAYTLLERGIQAPAFIAQHLHERACHAALGTPEAARSTFYYRDESQARRLALAGQGAAYLAAHAAERARHDALGTPEGERGDSYRLDARVAAQVAQREAQQQQQQQQQSARGAALGQRPPPRHVKDSQERRAEALQLHLARVGQSAVLCAQRLAREVGEGVRGVTYRENAFVATLQQQQQHLQHLQQPLLQRRQQQQQQLGGGSARQLALDTLILEPRRSVPTSPLSHWVGAALPLASWREPGANTVRILGPSELSLCGRSPAGGTRGLGGSGGGGGGSSSRGGGSKGCCCGWSGCTWDREQKELDTHKILVERGHKRPQTPW
jgi:hypothetical protein